MTALTGAPVKQRSHVSLIIVLLLVGSATVRIFGGTAEAIAREMDSFLEAPDEDLDAVQAAPSDTLESVFLELKERQESLDRREAMISERKRSVDALLMVTERKLAALEQAEHDLRETISIARSAADSDVAQLVSVYENMKPRDAALIFEEMEPSFAAGFLSRMRADAAAKIVQGLKPATAYSISVVLAGRNLGVVTE